MTHTVENRSVQDAEGRIVLTCPANVVGPMPTGPAFHVHRAGCGDLARKRVYRSPFAYGAGEDDFYEVTSMKEVVDSVYGPDAGSFYEEMGLDPEDPTCWTHYVQDFKLYPCITLPDYPIYLEA